MKIAGLHINKLEARHLPYLPALRSAWTTMLDPEQGQVQEVKLATRGKVLARVYVPDQELHRRIDENPEAAGVWAAQLCIDRRWMNPQADAWIVVNEKDVKPLVSMAKLARFDIAFIDALKPHGMRAIWGVCDGHPPDC